MPTVDPAAAELAAVERADTTPAPVAAPVDVRVTGAVTVTERPARTITTEQVPVTAQRARVVNAVISRTRLRIKNIGAEPVFLGGPEVTMGTGWPLDAQQVIELDARCAVFAVMEDGSTSVVAILSEHNDG